MSCLVSVLLLERVDVRLSTHASKLVCIPCGLPSAEPGSRPPHMSQAEGRLLCIDIIKVTWVMAIQLCDQLTCERQSASQWHLMDSNTHAENLS